MDYCLQKHCLRRKVMRVHHLVPFAIKLALMLWMGQATAFAQSQDDPITRLPEDITYKVPVSGAGGALFFLENELNQACMFYEQR
jgi:hypothetical protein